jgi:hypothetical protein
MQSDARERGRRKAQGARLPADLHQQLLDAIHEGRPFRTALRELDLTPNQVWRLTKTDQEWAEKLETALTAARRMTLSTAPTRPMCTVVYATSAGEHQSIRMGRKQSAEQGQAVTVPSSAAGTLVST